MRRPLRTTLLPRLSRRALIRGAAGAAIALPFLDAMRTRARAQTAGIRRLIFEFKPNGDEVDRRFDTVHETDFDFIAIGFELEDEAPNACGLSASPRAH